MGFKPAIKAAIEQHYPITITNIEDGPRQFVAETYILTDESGERYFCKIVEKPLFIRDIVKSLPAVAEMHKCGVSRISYPVESDQGTHIFVDDALVFLMNYIPAPQSYDYSPYAFGRLTAQIHGVIRRITSPAPHEDFQFPDQELFEQRFNSALYPREDNLVSLAFRNVIQCHEKSIRRYMEEFNHLARVCKKLDRPLAVTHGDAPGNVLVKTQDDIYIIDWDELMFAPPERDMWMIDHVPEFMEGYESVRPDFEINQDMRSFCTLKYFFRMVNHFFSEIMREEAGENYRMEHLENLDFELSEGWILPKLEDVKENSTGQIFATAASIEIRPYRDEDLTAIQEIRHKAFTPVFQSFRKLLGTDIYNVAFQNADKEQADYLTSVCGKASHNLHVAINQREEIMGFIAFTMDVEKREGVIDLNAVDPAAQGAGIAKKMYDFALARMKENNIMLVQVSTGGDESHAPARRAYAKAGFEQRIPSVTMYQLLR